MIIAHKIFNLNLKRLSQHLQFLDSIYDAIFLISNFKF